MKAFKYTALIIISMIIGAGTAAAADKNDYYPLTPGCEWVMQVTMLEDNKVIEQRIIIESPEALEGVAYSVMKQIDPKNKFTALILKNDKGVYWRKLSGKRSFIPEVHSYFVPQAPYLQFPLTRGSKWEWEGIYSLPWSDKKSTMKFEVQDVAEEVTVPAGKFKCVRIYTTKYLDKDTEDETCWYAPGVGLVKYRSKKMLKELKSYNIK